MVQINRFVLFTLMFLFLFSYVSAVRVDYSPNDKGIKDMKAVVKDTILFDLIAIGEQGTMELKSHNRPQEIIEVGTGWQVTMIYDTNFGQAHKDILGKVYFYDLKTGEEVEREYKFVYWGTEERERDTYETICEVNSTSKNETESCYSQVNGTETYTYEGWLDYNSKDLPKGQIKLGLMTNVLYKDKVDGVWEIQGKKIEKHAGWTSELSVGLVSYYKLDETSGTIAIDSVRGFNGTISNGITINQAGKINKAIKGDNTANAKISVPHNNLLNGGAELSLGLWRKGNTSSLEDLFLKGTDTNTTRNYFLRIDKGKILFVFHDGTTYREFITTNIVTSNNIWEFIVATYNDANNNVSIYVNANLVQSFTTTSSLVSNTLPLQLCGDVVGYTCTSFIDEMFIYNRTLSLSEITQLYNSGNGITYEELISINLISPIDYYNSSNQTIDFSANLTEVGGLGIANVSLVINDTIYDTNTSGLTGVYNFSETLSDGFYEWYIEAYDDTDELYESETRYFTIDTTPFIEFVSPTPANASNLSVPYIPVNVTVTEDYFENITFYFYKGGVLNETVTFTDGTRFYNKTGCTCDNWEINATVCTTTGKCNSTETRLLIIDILAPEIEILSPVTSYNYLQPNQTIDLNVSITDASDHLDSCWYKYNSSITYFNCSENQTFNYIPDQNTLTVYANDTSGNEKNESVSWSYKVLQGSIVYDNISYEGLDSSFYNFITLNGTIQSASLEYNGTNYTSSIYLSNLTYLYNMITLPKIESDVNNTFFWWIKIGDEWFKTVENVQLVKAINITNCTTSTLLNLSLKDEKIQTNLNGTLEVLLSVISQSETEVFVYNNTFTNRNNVQFCLFPEDLDKTLFNFNAQIKYYALDYSSELYNIQNANLSDYPRNLTLYDLSDNQSTKFKITYKGNNFIPQEGVLVQLLRKYIGEDSYKVVEAPITSSLGEVILHIDQDNNLYNIIVSRDGLILDTYENIVFTCDNALVGLCNFNLDGVINPYNDISSEILNDVAFQINSINDTNIVVTFSSLSGTPFNIKLLVKENSILGESYIYNNSVYSSAGSFNVILDDDTSMGIGENIYTFTFIKDGKVLGIKSFLLNDNGMEWDSNNYFIVVILLLSVVGMAFTSPELVIFNAILTFLIAGSLWLLNGMNFAIGLGSLIWLVISAGILIYKLSQQEDK